MTKTVDEAISQFKAVCIAEAIRLAFNQELDGQESRDAMQKAEDELREAIKRELEPITATPRHK